MADSFAVFSARLIAVWLAPPTHHTTLLRCHYTHRSTTLSIRKKADGIVVQKLCPGVDYVVTVRFPEPRQFKAFVSTGIWEALTGPW